MDNNRKKTFILFNYNFLLKITDIWNVVLLTVS